MAIYVAKVMWNDKPMSCNISVTNNLALAMRNVLVWLTPYTRIVDIDYKFDNNVYITLDSNKCVVIERFMMNEMLDKYI